MANRIQALRRVLAREHLSGFVVSDLANIRYLCGYSGSNGLLLVRPKDAWFFTDFRYKEQMRREVRGARGEMRKHDLYAEFPVERLRGLKRVGIEQASLTLARFRMLKRQVKRTRLVPVKDLVLGLRRTKDASEVKLIERAQHFTDAAFKAILPKVRPGVTERELAALIEFGFRREGEIAFPSIVASGPNAALPHAEPSDRRLRKGDVITFDIGCRFAGYCSDMTRTVFLGKPDPDMAQVYHIVHEAQRRALALVRPGASCADVDKAARDYITDCGYGKYFGHGTGHGVGLAVHELPNLFKEGKQQLAPGDVVTVEPGIYLPGLGGVRIEDMVLVTKSGSRNLTRSPKRLLVL